MPFGYLFKKRSKLILGPTHQFAFYFQNKIYTICLPFNADDKLRSLCNGQDKMFPIAPPLSTKPYESDLDHKFLQLDFSSNELLKGEKQSFEFKTNFSNEKMVALDLERKEIVDATFSNETGKGIFLVPHGTQISLDDYKRRKD